MIRTIVQLGLAVLLFYVLNWIGGHSSAYGYLQLSLVVRSDQAPAFNFILKTFTPVVYIIIISAACFAVNIGRFADGIWLVVLYYFGFRLLYNLVLGRALLLNWVSLSVQMAVGTCAAYLAYRHLILPRRPLFPDLDTIGNQLWILVALFLYAAFNSVRTSDDGSAKRKKRYISARFIRLRKMYGPQVKDQFPNHYMELVAYAVLVCETFNRPWFVRAIESAAFPWHSKTIGPMQVRSDVRLSDTDGVRLGVQQLKQYFEATEQELSGKPSGGLDVIRLTLAKYNRDAVYVSEVFDVLHVLWAQVAPEYRTEFEHLYSPGGTAGAPG